MRTMRNLILAMAVIAFAGIGINAFAHGGGMGWGGGWGHHGPGWHHGGGYGYGEGAGGRWRAEEYRKFEQQRETFFKDTQAIRNQLYDKELELRNELAKENPDPAVASQLQKELSVLEAEFDQKRIDHMVEMRKLNPTTGGGPMMGYGPATGGYCWQ